MRWNKRCLSGLGITISEVNLIEPRMCACVTHERYVTWPVFLSGSSSTSCNWRLWLSLSKHLGSGVCPPGSSNRALISVFKFIALGALSWYCPEFISVSWRRRRGVISWLCERGDLGLLPATLLHELGRVEHKCETLLVPRTWPEPQKPAP